MNFTKDLKPVLTPSLPNSVFGAIIIPKFNVKKECNEITAAYENRTGTDYYTCDKVTDNIFIVTRHFNGKQKECYLPCVKKDGVTTRYNVAFDTFDQAVIAAYSYLYTGHEDAGYWACKLMDVK